MATTAVDQVDEEALVREAVKTIAYPEGVRLRQVKLDSDWEGDPAWRIIFAVSKRIPLSKPFVRSLTRLSFEVVEKVTELRFGKFPYVDFEESR